MSSAAIPTAANNPFAGYISQIDAISIDDVVGEARLGNLNFGGARPTLESLKDFVEQVRSLDGAGLPGRMVAKSATAFQDVLNAVQQIKNFDANNYGGNPTARQNLIQQLSSNYETLLENAVPVLLYSNFRSSGIQAVQASTYSLLAEVEKRKDEVVRVVNEARELLEGQKKLSAEIAIAGYGTLFANEALGHEKAANKWLSFTGLLTGLVAWGAWANYRASLHLLNEFSTISNSQAPRLPASLTVQFTVAKVILFTIGLSAAYWSARVYRSHRHNSIVNKHRANALTSFQEFVISATDPEVKNAVLLQTTACIYAPQPTGFSSSSDTDGESPLKILEIVRNFQK